MNSCLPIKKHLGISAIFSLDVIDAPDVVEHALYYQHAILKRTWHGLGRADIGNAVILQANKPAVGAYADLMHGLLYGMLTDAAEAPMYFHLAQSVVNDDWSVIIERLKYFTFTKYLSMCSLSRKQLFWLVDRLLALSCKGCDGLVIGLVRQIKAGFRDEPNLQTMRLLLGLLEGHQEWLLQQASAIPYVLYGLLRLLSEDFLEAPTRRTLAALCGRMLSERYRECALLGRDLVRCLIDVAHVAELWPIWAWLLKGSSAGRPDGQPEGAPARAQQASSSPPIARLLATPTLKKYTCVRLTPDAESAIKFILNAADGAKEAFYTTLFASAHLPLGPSVASDGAALDCDPAALIIDAIRHIVVGHRPSDAEAASSAVPRWALIGALLRRLRTSYAAAQAKTALLLDWLLFDDKDADAAMLVEPALLLMARSVGRHDAKVAHTLLEFLHLAKSMFYPPMAGLFADNIDRAMACSIRRGTIRHLGVLLDAAPDQSARTTYAQLFPLSN